MTDVRSLLISQHLMSMTADNEQVPKVVKSIIDERNKVKKNVKKALGLVGTLKGTALTEEQATLVEKITEQLKNQ